MFSMRSGRMPLAACSNARWRGRPGPRKHILPAAVTTDPSSGTIPTGYLILNVTQGTLKRHAGGYSWETIVGAASGKIGFYGVPPVTQPAGAD
jgi:hypothetical protein